MAKALTAKAIENLRPAATRQEVPDGLIRGLFFVLQPSGKAGWAVRYRARGQTRKLTLGTYPAIDLKAARELASRALVAVAAGGDPAAEKQAAKREERIPREDDLVEKVVERFIERYAKANAPRSWQETKRLLEREVVARWKERRLGEISRRDVHALLDEIVDRGSPIMANRALAALRRMCGWAVERDLIATSPCAGIKAPSAERSRDRVLEDDELRLVWLACDRIGWPFGPLIRLLILLGQRREEVGAMRWSEVDLERRTWTLPKERTKNEVEHIVPLSPQAIAILKELPHIVPPKGAPDFVFTTGGGTAVTGYGKAKSRLDAFIAEARGGEALPGWVLHDLRRSLASGCARLGVNLPVIEKVLNHVSGSFGGIAGVYQRHSFAAEKAAALALWGRHVEGLVEGKSATVLELRAASA